MALSPVKRDALGAAVRQLRGRRGMSQEDVALDAGLHRAYVGDVERGERNPTFANLDRLSGALGVDLSELVLAYERHLRERSGE